MRVDYSGNVEISNYKNVESKGPDMAAAGEVTTKRNDLIKDTPYSITATTVEKALFSLESELDRIKEDAASIDLSLIKTQMAVLSNTMSKADMERLGQEGYTVNGTPVQTIVTVMDKIKLELAKSGMDISIFGDDLSVEQLEAITGSAKQAMSMAADLKDLTEGDIAYLTEHELTPTIENLYLAQHSGGSSNTGESYELPKDANLQRQIEQVITEAGLPVNETTLGYGKLLLANDTPLTPENLNYVHQLKNLNLPPTAEEAEAAITTAVSEGQKPGEAYLLQGYSFKDRAIGAQAVIDQAGEEDLAAVVERGQPVTIEALKQARTYAEVTGQIVVEAELKLVTARRQLEEIRLTMTVEANYHLLKQGMPIETMELSKLVDELKSIEEKYYKTLLEQAGIENAEENAALLQETMTKTEALKGFPAYTIGRFSMTEVSVEVLYQSGSQLKITLEQAQTAYETMMTTPRQDLGDSIQKAFSNVNAILEDLNLEASPSNQRAVRILAYNQMEITQEAIAGVKAADEKLQNLFENLKPSVVLEMIREGVHPLRLDVASLNAKAEEILSRIDPGQEEKYSEYLWELEQRQEITSQEKESYIGIYRLLRQIEKTDGAVIGAILQQGGELSLKNLLSAVRSRRNAGMDVTVDESFGAREAEESKDAIHRQIEAAYQTDCAKDAFKHLTPEGMQQVLEQENWQELTPEQLLWQLRKQQEGQTSDSYYWQQRELFGDGSMMEEAVLKLLADYELPMDTWHMLAANHMMNHRNDTFRKLFDPENLKQTPDLKELKETVLKEFAEAVKTPEDMAKAQQTLAETAEHIMEGMINEEDISSAKVQDLKLMRTQIQLSTRMSREEHYAIPVMIADEMTNVQLKIVRGSKRRGMVDILFETTRLGKVAARIRASESRMEGLVAAERQETCELLKEKEEELKSRMQPEEGQAVRFNFVRQENADAATLFQNISETGHSRRDGEDSPIMTRQLYGIARAFLEMAKGLA